MRFLLACAIGAGGGAVFFALGLPLPFMLGAMSACILAAMSGLPVQAPMSVRAPMSAIIGAMIGATVTPALLSEIPTLAVSFLWMCLFILVSGAFSVSYFRWVIGYDMRTAYFAGMPGGLIEMVLFAEEYGGDSRKVAIVHTLRVVLVIFTVPFLVLSIAGAERITGFDTAIGLRDIDADFVFWFSFCALVGIGLGKLLRLPARFFVGPMVVSVVVHTAGWTDFKLPFEMVIVAQIVLGTTIGCRFVGLSLRALGSVAVAAVGSTLGLMALTAVFAWAAAAHTGFGFLALFMSYAPGGVSEISLVALALQIDTALVTTHHIARIIVVGMVGPMIFVLLRRFLDPPGRD